MSDTPRTDEARALCTVAQIGSTPYRVFQLMECLEWELVEAKAQLAEARQAVQTLEAALRGEQGIIFEVGYEVNVSALREQLAEALTALEMIAGKRPCIDDLMGNVDIANAVLAKHKEQP